MPGHDREQSAQPSFPGLLSALSLLAAIYLVSVAPTRALACLAPSYMQTVFFDEVPDGVDASAIVQVRIIDVSNKHPARYFVGIGKVEKVIKGHIDRDTVRVLTVLSDCENRFPVGAHGIVMGDMQRDSNGEIEILAMTEPFYARRNKKVFDPTK